MQSSRSVIPLKRLFLSRTTRQFSVHKTKGYLIPVIAFGYLAHHYTTFLRFVNSFFEIFLFFLRKMNPAIYKSDFLYYNK